MRSARFSYVLTIGLLLVLPAKAISAQAAGSTADTLNQRDVEGLKQGWWQIEGPVADKPDYAAGQLYEEGRYTDNRRSGTWKRYWPGGTIMSVITYVAGRPRGAYTTYYSDGSPEEKGNWDLDRNTGGFQRWHPNGNLAQQFAFGKDGLRNGDQKYFHDNGQLAVDVNIAQGREEGTMKRWNANGGLEEVAEFHDGEAAKIKEVKPKSVKKMPAVAPDAAPAPAKTTDDRTNSSVFRANGWNTLYDMQHRLAQQGEFHNGRLLNGKVYKYNRNGILYRVEVYANGRYAGNAILTEDDR